MGFIVDTDSMVVARFYRSYNRVTWVGAVDHSEKVPLVGSHSPVPGGFRTEITYSGRDADTVRLTYREYSGDTVRPAFDQSLVFDRSQPGPVGFRGTRLTILEATNMSITYVVESHSETSRQKQ